MKKGILVALMAVFALLIFACTPPTDAEKIKGDWFLAEEYTAYDYSGMNWEDEGSYPTQAEAYQFYNITDDSFIVEIKEYEHESGWTTVPSVDTNSYSLNEEEKTLNLEMDLGNGPEEVPLNYEFNDAGELVLDMTNKQEEGTVIAHMTLKPISE